MRESLANAWLVARFDLREYARQRIAVGLLVQPLLFLGVVAVLPGILAGNEAKADKYRPSVAVEGPAPAAATLAAQLRHQHLRADAKTNATAAVRSRHADVGVVLSPGRALRVVVANTRQKSRDGYGELEAALGRMRADGAGAQHLDVTRAELSKTKHGQQLAFNRLLPFYALVQLFNVISVAGNQFSSTASKRAVEPLLVLPFRRSEIAVGKAMFAAFAGVLALGALVLPLAVFAALPVAIGGVHFSVSLSTVLLLIAGGIVTLPLLGALGVLAGATARTPGEAGAVGVVVGIVPVAIAAFLSFFMHGPIPRAALLVPIIGHDAILTAAVRGTAGAVDWLLIVASTAVWTAILLAPAGRLLSRDRMVVRPSD